MFLKKTQTGCFQILAHYPGRIDVGHNRCHALPAGLPLVYIDALGRGYSPWIDQHFVSVGSLPFRLFQNYSEERQTALPVDRKHLHLRLSDVEGVSRYRLDDLHGNHPAQFPDSKALLGHPIYDDWRFTAPWKLPIL